MREKIVLKLIDYIKKYKCITNNEEEIIQYGLESIYILVTKMIIIFTIAIILGIFKEMIIFLIIFNVIRTFAFGLHASKSWICLLISSVSFLGLPFLLKVISIPLFLKLILGISLIIIIYKYSPADTVKRPIINKKRRLFFKYTSTSIAILYIILSLIIRNIFISNCFIFGLLLEVLFISPLTYKIFKLPYNNYLNYVERNEKYVC